MAEYSLLCAKLRDNGFAVIADVIEKLQVERDALEQERDKLLAERDELIEIAKEGNTFCSTCAHIANQYDEKCELDVHHCQDCSRDDCCCKECYCGERWEWKGVQE